MVRYPLGGMLSWVLQYLSGFKRLGHDVVFVEKSTYANECFDPVRRTMTDDCRHGVAVVSRLLGRVGLADRWCFVDVGGAYHGMSAEQVASCFRTADLFVDMGTHGSWMEEAAAARLRVLIDGEPGFTQMKMVRAEAAGAFRPAYDRYFTTGANVGTPRSTAPAAGKPWEHVFHPVDTSMFVVEPVPRDAPFSTIMNWQSHGPVEFEGRTYCQKDVEFEKFIDLPRRVAGCPMEVAVSGKQTPRERLRSAGWRLRSAHEVTESPDGFVGYLHASRGEFSVCKNVFVATWSGWFSDRSAAYLACGRPVVLQDTGFSEHLPCGEGLFAVQSVGEAADAIARVLAEYDRHAAAARRIAEMHLEAKTVLAAFLGSLGIE
jgi:hypothetical protein